MSADLQKRSVLDVYVSLFRSDSDIQLRRNVGEMCRHVQVPCSTFWNYMIKLQKLTSELTLFECIWTSCHNKGSIFEGQQANKQRNFKQRKNWSRTGIYIFCLF